MSSTLISVQHFGGGNKQRSHVRQPRPGSAAWLMAVLPALVLFVDISLPVLGSSNRFIMLVIIPLFLWRHVRITLKYCTGALFLLVGCFLVPALFVQGASFWGTISSIAFQVAMLGVAVLAARSGASTATRRLMLDALVALAAMSAVAALAQRYGGMPALGLDRWGRASSATGDFRGAALLSDPNFLAVGLAGCLPIVLKWHRSIRVRMVMAVTIVAGLYATDSRAGILLAVLGVAICLSRDTVGLLRSPDRRRVRRLVVISATCVSVLLLVNVGGQRDRLVDALLVALSIREVSDSVDAGAAVSARDRRELLGAWIDLGDFTVPGWGGPKPGRTHSYSFVSTKMLPITPSSKLWPKVAVLAFCSCC